MLIDPNNVNSCSLAFAISLFDGKWKPFIIWHISIAPEGRIRYGALKKSLPWQISHKMFSQHLHELEDAKIIVREDFQETPPRVEYYLTEKGMSLANIMYLLRDWGAVYGEFPAEVFDRSRGTLTESGISYDTNVPIVRKHQHYENCTDSADFGISWNINFKDIVESRRAQDAIAAPYRAQLSAMARREKQQQESQREALGQRSPQPSMALR